MAKITIKPFFTVRQALGGIRELSVDVHDATLRGLLALIRDQYGSDFWRELNEPVSGRVKPEMQILVNGRHYRHHPQGIDQPLTDGDLVALFPLVAGG